MSPSFSFNPPLQVSCQSQDRPIVWYGLGSYSSLVEIVSFAFFSYDDSSIALHRGKWTFIQHSIANFVCFDHLLSCIHSFTSFFFHVFHFYTFLYPSCVVSG
ncbi:hypothetical protein U1Q18_052695 [Sarracenia purpurea var. burkii]